MTLLDYFNKNYGVQEVGAITWSHAVNSLAKAEKYLNNPAVMFVESDVRMSAAGRIILAHPPDIASDLTLEVLLARMAGSKQGLKLDFKDPEAVAPSLKLLQDSNLKQPVMLNADILRSNGAAEPEFKNFNFIALAEKLYPGGILSLGWTTSVGYPYTKENVDEMLELTGKIAAELTFPVRACLLPASWPELRRLIQRENRTLTIWNNEGVDDNLKNWIRSKTDPEKTFYDFIDGNKNPVKLW